MRLTLFIILCTNVILRGMEVVPVEAATLEAQEEQNCSVLLLKEIYERVPISATLSTFKPLSIRKATNS